MHIFSKKGLLPPSVLLYPRKIKPLSHPSRIVIVDDSTRWENRKGKRGFRRGSRYISLPTAIMLTGIFRENVSQR